MNVSKYAAEVLDTYDSKSRHLNSETARSQAVSENAIKASEAGQAPIGNAAKVARHAIDTFKDKTLNGGMSRADAMKAAQEATASRFDDRGRDLAKSQERPRSRGMGL